MNNEVKASLTRAEELLAKAAVSTGEYAVELRDKGLIALRQAKEKAQDLQDTLTQNTKQAARVTDDYVHTHPWKAIGIAAGLGLIIGLIINRK